MFKLDNKIAIVTGGGSGIGKAICLVLAQQGAVVHVIDIHQGQADETVNEIKAKNGNAFSHVTDVSVQSNITTLFNKIGPIDILVNCAGISHIGNALNTNETDFEKVFQVNVKGVYNCLYAGIPCLQKNGGGAIVNISSIAAKVGLSDRFAYSMSKGAVHAMTLSVAKDYLQDNIRCNSISPARVHTPFVDNFLKKNYPGHEQVMFEQLSKTQPIGRMGQPEEIAAQVLYLCSDEASFVTGSDYAIDGGYITLNS
jgi:NAD(P)-dependent dehydrogenase (short-subunit alcohol dehydrogenase family)